MTKALSPFPQVSTDQSRERSLEHLILAWWKGSQSPPWSPVLEGTYAQENGFFPAPHRVLKPPDSGRLRAARHKRADSSQKPARFSEISICHPYPTTGMCHLGPWDTQQMARIDPSQTQSPYLAGLWAASTDISSWHISVDLEEAHSPETSSRGDGREVKCLLNPLYSPIP